MNEYKLNVGYSEKDVAKSAGAVWQSWNKRWVYFGSALPEQLARFADKIDENIESRCNTCHCEFDTDPDVIRQSASNRGYLATKFHGRVVQECCEACVQDCESAADDQ